ncbi:MAG: 2-C-methyl-D-erythritol 4-phosphate cytidylyltransferase [Paludibacteraceae bacterium]
MKQQKTAIIVAGGKGERMNMQAPKQFLEIAGKPVLMHTIERFYSYSGEIRLILVLPANQIVFWNELCHKYNFHIPHQIVEGGSTRYFSVKNALEIIENEGLIAIHDGVRPLVDIKTIENCFIVAQKSGAAIPAVDLVDSIRKKTESGSIAVNRKEYKLIQTPQIFRAEIILESYKQPFNELFTDDASVVEAAGYYVKLVEGNRENIKITTPFDLKLAEVLLS